MALWSTQARSELSTRNISFGKSGRCVRLKTLPPSCAVIINYGKLNFLKPSELPRYVTGLLVLYFYPYLFLYLNLNMFPAQFTKPITQHFYFNPATAQADTKAMC